MSIEEALKNEAADEPRRLISRSGKTQYVETPSEQLAASYKAFNDLIYNLTFDRAEATVLMSRVRAWAVLPDRQCSWQVVRARSLLSRWCCITPREPVPTRHLQ